MAIKKRYLVAKIKSVYQKGVALSALDAALPKRYNKFARLVVKEVNGTTMQSSQTVGKKRILVVDDERHIVRLVQVNLERHGYDVLTAYDGVECLEKAKSEKPDLIVLDVMMPRMDGFQALQQLKTDSVTSQIPVIMLTARTQDQDVLKGYQYGTDLYLPKPFNPLELITMVKRIFESQEEEENIVRL